MLGVGALGTTGSLGDGNLRLVNSKGTVVASDNDSGAAFDAALTFTVASTGVYALELSAVGSLTGNYLVQGAVVNGAAMTSSNSYLVTNASTLVIEGAGGAGTDTLRASISYSLQTASEIEVLRTSNDRGRTAINLTGNDFAQAIAGNLAANKLDGRGGNDTLTGFDGSDVLIGGGGSDTFRDTTAGLRGDRIEDFTFGDRILITDANLTSFTFSLTGSTLNYSGGSLTFGSALSGQIVASAAAGGGVQLTLVGTPQTRDVRNDFNGDGRSDVLWRDEQGGIFNYLGTSDGGLAANGALYTVIDPSWHVVALGDFNGDRRDDILWRNENGAIFNLLSTANGSVLNNGDNSYMALSTSWEVAGAGDFNGDGRDDVLWRDANGAIFNFLGTTTGGFVNNSSSLYTVVGGGWHVAGIGDFNGDGRDDILWQHDNGAVFNFLSTSNGGIVNNGNSSYSIGLAGWHVAGVGDFNGDGRDDLLAMSPEGELTNWLGTAAGGFVDNSANALTLLTRSTKIIGIGDFNGDGRDDVLWRDAGAAGTWLGQSNGAFVSNPAPVLPMIGTHVDVQPNPDTWL